MSADSPPRLTDAELAAFKADLAVMATKLWALIEGAGMDPTDIRVYCAAGLIWALGSKASGKTRDEFLAAAEDAYANAEYHETVLEGGSK